MAQGLGVGRQALIAAGGAAAVLGLYWDDAWHTDVGRDDFASPPHLLLYAGVAVLLIVIAGWARRRHATEGRIALRDPTVALPLFGAAVTLGAAPVDELWHQLFGRDAVVWSPPHMVAVAGMIAFAAGLLLATRRGAASASRLATAVIGAFLISAVAAAVMEFEADVPQFAVVWYLPALLAGLTFAFALIRRAVPSAWSVTAAAGLYMLLRAAVVGFLLVLGHSPSTVMPTIIPAFAFELGLRRGWTRVPLAGAVTAATVLSHAPAHALQPPGLSFAATDIVTGILAGWLVVWAILTLLAVDTSKPGTRPTARVGVVALLLAGLAPFSAGPAWAHDPGQGAELAPVQLRAVRSADHIALTAQSGDCAGWSPVRVVARRAGRELTAPLRHIAPCRFVGQLTVDDPGRWFVYAEIDVHGQLAEAWLPVEHGRHSKRTELYLADVKGPRSVQVLAGVLLYGVVLATLAAVAAAYRRVDRPFWIQPSEASSGMARASTPRKV